jgi:predicted lipoprotein with Yx(FWY)xxD motif
LRRVVELGVGLVAVLVLTWPFSVASAKIASNPPMATPPGIMFADASLGLPGGAIYGGASRVVFATSTGLPLYTSDRDVQRGKSECLNECVKTWHPVIATDTARESGDWSLVVRPDHTRQWAYLGKPLYTFEKDAADPEYNTLRVDRAIKPKGQDGVWHVAEVAPAKRMRLPVGVSVSEIVMAPGQVLVTGEGRALYAFEGKTVNDARSLLENWEPLPAAMMDVAVGDFSVVVRAYGIRQWAYRGNPLYTFKGDLVLGDLNGTGVTARMNPALIMKYFLPDSVAIRRDQRRGGVLSDANTGETLYARDRILFDGARGGHYLRGDNRGSPLVGLGVGVAGCDADCERLWRPFLASRDAQPQGYWGLVDKGNGVKQWSYRGYPLYTHTGEPPGVVSSDDTYTVAVNQSSQTTLPPFLGFALYWRAAVP